MAESEKEGLEPAFPQTIDDMGTIRSNNPGINVRLYVASKALQGLMAGAEWPRSNEGEYPDDARIRVALTYADMLIAEELRTRK